MRRYAESHRGDDTENKDEEVGKKKGWGELNRKA